MAIKTLRATHVQHAGPLFAARVRRSFRGVFGFLGGNRRHVRYCRFKRLCVSFRLSFRFVFIRRSLAFDLSLFGLLLFGHVAAPPQSTGTNSGGNAFLPFGIVT
jgi:hypothetical protein